MPPQSMESVRHGFAVRSAGVYVTNISKISNYHMSKIVSQNLQNQQLSQKQNCEAKLANSATITIIIGPELGATTGFGTGRLHPGVASAFSMHVDLLQHLC